MPLQVYLTGYRGTGKSVVGARLAEYLRIPCVDLDAEIEREAGKTIREIFDEGGESLFRDWETRCLKSVASDLNAHDDAQIERDDRRQFDCVISLGGGAILRKENREIIRSSGLCVWLDATATTLSKRISKDGATESARPALTGLPPEDEIAELLRVRRPMYQEVSDVRIDTENQSVDEVVAAVTTWLGNR